MEKTQELTWLREYDSNSKRDYGYDDNFNDLD